NRDVHEALRPVRRRLRLVLILRSVALGLLVGGFAGLLLGAYRLLLAPQGTVPGWLIAAAMVPPPLLGLIFGALRPQGWRLAAVTVDARYRLKDRAVTAVDFLRKSEPTALHSLQLADAAEHLSKVSATDAVPLKVSRALPAALISLALAAAMLTVPL